MAFVVPTVSESVILRRILGLNTNGNLSLRLFTNEGYEPDEDTVLADLTECSTAGYAAITLSSGSWTITTVSGQTTAQYPEQVFTMTAAATIQGYFILDASSNLILVEAFTSAPFVLPGAGGQIAITPTISLE
jgi:hypothetical protein